jgi:hypothetical protein
MLNYITKVLLNILNSKGPEKDPCGTSKSTSKGKEEVSKMRTVMPISKATKKPIYAPVRNPMGTKFGK